MYRFSCIAFCLLLIQNAHGQVIRSRSCLNALNIPETILSGPAVAQFLPNQIISPPTISGPILPNMAVPNLPIEAMVARPTVFSNGPVQHQSPANNLANALQLLTVSSLLSEKLPYNGVPVYSKVLGGCGCGAPIAIC